MEVKPFGPVQLYETAGVVELPDNTTNGDEQVLTPPEAETFGGVIFCVTVTVAVPVQPFTGFVMTKV